MKRAAPRDLRFGGAELLRVIGQSTLLFMGSHFVTAKRAFSGVGRLVHLARTKGLRKIVKVGFASYVFTYSRYTLSYRSLAAASFAAEVKGIHCRLANIEDVERLKVFEPYRWQSEFHEWLSDGSWVFIALDGELPVAFNVASANHFLHPPWSKIPLREDQVWSVDQYTIPSHRRRHIGQALAAYKDRFLTAQGLRQSVSFRTANNEPAAAMWDDDPRREAYRLTYLRILFYSKTWLEPRTKRKLSAAASAGADDPQGPTK